MNSVRLYSNGTAVIGREYTFPDQGPLRIAIPVRKTDLDDVVSSITVFGDVTVDCPPTYTPTNARKPTLTLDPAKVLKDLATKLAGAAVEIDAGTVYQGTLLGLQSSRRELNGAVVEARRLVVLTETGVRQIDDASVTAIRFTDAAIRAEVEDALQASIDRIKPDSSLVELTVRPNAGAKSALLVYAIPVAAWKLRYHLETSAEGTELEGQAIVDNDTDDDWTDAMITVITGEPITFSTDLAETRRPARSRVNIVADRAAGAVIAEEVVRSMPDMDLSEFELSPLRGPVAASPFAIDALQTERATQQQAEVRESGDFSVFTSPRPISVAAKRSAIVPLFRAAVAEASSILFYREKDDARRPFRAVRVKNESVHSWGRGICEVFVDGDFQGKSILEPTKPGAEVLLIHAKETGVAVLKEASRIETRRLRVRISEGTVYYEELRRRETVYRVQNSHPNPFDLEIEHPSTWNDTRMTVSASSGKAETDDIPDGWRISARLEASGSLGITVNEENVQTRAFALSASWLGDNLIASDSPGADDPGVRRCVDLQTRIDEIQTDMKEKETAAKEVLNEQTRLIKLIPNGHGDQANAWRTDLANAEKELRELKRSTIPRLDGQLRKARQALHEALAGLRYDHSDNTKI